MPSRYLRRGRGVAMVGRPTEVACFRANKRAKEQARLLVELRDQLPDAIYDASVPADAG
jgi:hypothetical protein